jgi:hypothetical protein
MVKLVLSKKNVTLTRIIKQSLESQLDYEINKSMYDFRGFKLIKIM